MSWKIVDALDNNLPDNYFDFTFDKGLLDQALTLKFPTVSVAKLLYQV